MLCLVLFSENELRMKMDSENETKYKLDILEVSSY